MKIMRTFSLAGVLPAAVLLTGCWGDCWCTGGSCKKSQPAVQQDPPTAKAPAQTNNWSNPPSSQTQTAGAGTASSQQLTTGNYPQGSGVDRPTATPTVTQQTGVPPVDPTPSPPPSQIRIVNGTAPPSTGSTTIIPQPRDQSPSPPREIQLNNSSVTAPPPPDLPPPPATGTGAGTSTSKYTPAQPINPPLPPETMPGQGKIPALPPGPVHVD